MRRSITTIEAEELLNDTIPENEIAALHLQSRSHFQGLLGGACESKEDDSQAFFVSGKPSTGVRLPIRVAAERPSEAQKPRFPVPSSLRDCGPFLRVGDTFQKVILFKDVVNVSLDHDGIVTMSTLDFLLDQNGLRI